VSTADQFTQDRSLLLAKWRQIIRVLMEPTYGHGFDIDQNDPRQVNICDLVNKFHQIMQSLAGDGVYEQDLRQLTCLICEGAIFGYKVFTQPSEWSFDWSSSRSSQVPELVLFPALLKTTDDHGHFLPVPELKVSVTFAGSG
jgi:hypothetical protein